MTISLASRVIQMSPSGFSAIFGKKAPKKTSPRFAPVCALAIKPPVMPASTNPYIARAVKRVNAHTKVSKLKPRLEMGRVRDAISAYKRVAHYNKERKANDQNVCYPFDVDGSADLLHQFR